MKRALHISAYRRLLLAYGLNELAWSVGTLALTVLVYRRTGSALGSTAFFLCSQVIPALVSPVIVARVDRRAPRSVLPVLYALEAVLFAVLAWMTARFSLPAMLAIALLDGAVAVVARALARTAVVEIMRPLDLLHEANALISLVFSGCYMAGPAIGGVVVAAGGTVAALLANCALFAGIALVLATARQLPGASVDPEPGEGRLRAALAHVGSDRPVRAMLILQGAGMVAFTICVPVEVVLAQHTLHAGPGGYGAMLSGWGAGAVVGSAAYARWRRRSGAMLMAASGVALGVGFGLMAAAPSITVAVVGAVLGGTGNGIGGMAARTLLQEYTPQRWMAMVTSLNESISLTAPGLGIVLGGVLATVGDPRVALGIGAVGSLAYAAAAWGLLRPAVLPPPPDLPETPPATPTPDPIVPIGAESHESLA